MGMYLSYKEADSASIERMIARCGEESPKEDHLSGCENSLPEEPEVYILSEVEAKGEVCYLDKMWDGLHCLLTGTGACSPVSGNLLSEAVVGGQAYSDEGAYFVSYISPERLPQILAALNEFDLEAALEAFSPEHFEREGIYPHIWLKEDKEELKRELRAVFLVLRDFYDRMVKKNKGVIMSLY